MCLKIYQLDPALAFFSCLSSFIISIKCLLAWISMATSFTKDRKKIELLTDIDMLSMAEKGIKGGIVI